MIRFLLACTGALFLGIVAAFFWYVSLLSIATIVCILVGLTLMFGLGVHVGALPGNRQWRGAVGEVALLPIPVSVQK